jgi:hypothetical protein
MQQQLVSSIKAASRLPNLRPAHPWMRAVLQGSAGVRLGEPRRCRSQRDHWMPIKLPAVLHHINDNKPVLAHSPRKLATNHISLQ